MIKRIIGTLGGVTMLVLLPVLLTLVNGVGIVAAGRHGSDFAAFYDSGRAVLHGHSPYPSLHSLPSAATPWFTPFVYPPVAAFSMVPLSLLSFGVASVLFFVLDLAAIGLALWLLGVRDWRCYGIAYGSAPVFAAAGMGTVSPLLLLGVATAWRWRNQSVAAGALVAYLVTAKLFLWPLWLWLVRTRRFAAAAVAAAASIVGIALSWSAIGFAGLREYPQLLGRLTDLEGPHSYSLYALARSLGLGSSTAQGSVYFFSLLAVAAAFVFVKGDRQWCIAAIGIALLATPILWPHYLVLLFVPVALTHRRLSPVWIAPLLLWLDTYAWSEESPLRIAGVLVLAGAIVAVGLGVRLNMKQGHSELSARPEPSLP